MKGKIVLKVILWIMVLGSAGLIFWFSAQNAAASDGTSGSFVRLVFGLFPSFRAMSSADQAELVLSVMHIARKCAHFCIYAFLGFWLIFLVRQYRKTHTLIITGAAALAYAISDEIHQYFVPGRACQPKDVCIDLAGSLTGALIALIFAVIWQKLRKYLKRVK